MDVASKFAKFILPLNKAFVDQAWSQELFEIEGNPYSKNDDSQERVNHLIDASESLRRSLQSSAAANEFSSEFWTHMRELNMSQRNLLPYFSYFISSYSKDSNNEKADTVGLIVASMFLKLLSMPGAVVFDMFHQVVFDYSVAKLNMAVKVQQEKPGKRDTIAEGYRRSVLKKVDVLLDDLSRLLKQGFLKDRPLAVNITVKKLIDLLSTDKSALIRDFSQESDKNLSFRAYKALYVLSEDEENLGIVLENLLLFVAHAGTPSQARCQFETLSCFVQYLIKTKEPKMAWQPTIVFMQQLLTRSIDRAENRQKIGQCATFLIKKLPKQLRNCVLLWAFKYLAFSERSTQRLMALEFFLHLLQEKEFDHCSDEELIPYEMDDNVYNTDEIDRTDPQLRELVFFPHKGGKSTIKHYHIFCLVLLRINDVAPLIRTKALNMLADILIAPDHGPLSQIMNKVFLEPYDAPVDIQSRNVILWPNRKEFLDEMLDSEFILPDAQKIADMLSAVAVDERVFVRKAALQALFSLGKLSHYWLSSSLLELLSSHCRDPAMIIRKQVISNLTELLRTHFEQRPNILNYWVASVVPCLQDPESKAQELVQEHLHDLFFGNLDAHSGAPSEANLLPWKILRLISNQNLKKLFSDTFQLWVKQKKLPNNLVKIVKSFTETSFNKEAWLLLAIISESQNIPDVQFTIQYFRKNSINIKMTEINTLYSVLRVLMLNTKSMNTDQAEDLRDYLCSKIDNFLLPTDLIGAAMDLLAAIDISTEHLMMFESWCKTTYKKLELKISMYISRPGHAPPDSTEELKLREMTTLGDIVRLASLSHYSSKIITPLVSVALSGEENAPLSGKKLAFEASPRLRAVAVITLGKIALLQEQAAFEAVGVFQHLLKTSEDNILKCNTLTSLADLIGKYATLVDSIVSELETCLRDPDVDMRRHALVVVVQLLQGDFVKLRGTTLLFYLLSTLCDPEEDLRDMTACYLTNTLIAKEPNILQQNLIAAVLLFNAYKDHERFSKSQISSAQLNKLSLRGPENKDNRLTIYNFMLEYMSDDHRFDSLHRICTQILGGFVDGVFKLSEEEIILEDALAILCSENIHLRCMKVASDGEVTDVDEAFSKLYDQTKKLFVAQEVKNKIIENIVPIVKSLRVILRKERSRLADDLMRFLRDFMKDFKSEVDEIFSGDKLLVEEIMFDIRQLEEQDKADEGVENEPESLDHI